MRSAPTTRTFFGWRVVAAAFVIAVFAWGVGFYGPAIYVAELVRSRGWPVAAVSGAMTTHFLVSAALVIGLSDAHVRFGLVAVTRFGVIAFGLGVLGFAHATEIWHLYVASVFTGAGWATISSAAINAYLAPWFVAQRGVALSHAFNGASLGGIVFSPLWAALIGRFGFETAAAIIAAGGLAVLWPLAGYALRPTPQSLGQWPDGTAARAAVAADALTPPMSNRDVLRDRTFRSLTVGFSIGIFAQMGIITHLVVRLTPDIGETLAALSLSVATVCAVIGRMSVAVFIEDHRRRLAGALNFVMQAVGVALLIFGTSLVPLYAGCILMGLGIGNLLSLPPLILQSEQRPENLGRALALLTAINTTLYAFAPAAFGVLRDASGSYSLPFAIAAALQLLSALIVVLGTQALSLVKFPGAW